MLPDFEAWVVFAKVAETGSFVGAAAELGLSKPTVSKLVSRLEAKIGSALLHRTSRRLSLTESGRACLDRALHLLADAQALEEDAFSQSAAPRGLVRVAAPMSFGIAHLGPALPEFCALYPQVSVELSLADERVDIVEAGFDLALRISQLEDSSLLARRLCPVRILLVGSPAYFERHGRPTHPKDLTAHVGLFYTNARKPGAWVFEHANHGRYAVTLPSPLRANNADILQPALLAGLGLAMQPDFMVWREVREGSLEVVLADWSPPGMALHLVTPPSARRPRRVEALIDFLAKHLAAAPWLKTLPS
jgi:DNA-binding transcriptional LysR family regulator